jgi:predicted DNA-binding protein (UPF0251 family)
MTSIAEKLDRGLDRSGGPDACWPWKEGISGNGYGKVYDEATGKTISVHRAAWERENGPVPAGLKVLHHCDVRACGNVRHLFLGTDADNMADRDAKGRQASGDRNGMRLHPDRRPKGEKNGQSKLTVTEVEAIRRGLTAGYPKAKLARRFGVSDATVHAIGRGEVWR